ncbi:smoothelin-like protein 2 isoform X2 [Tympanuchus pallidicinctus]|uniref:smoothelin-like protein 2 isoform X2 n=1 Tax=Tympanuchus pallidicinctus TaxID=109042 RepID=UPI0022873092|nr:smoothelin-like protein 2 isoform X2 [Tympanuchus pallidicinctus]
MASEIDNLNSHEAKTVCEALGRYEDTLRGAVREIHVDIQVFKQGVSRQVDEVLRLASPLARTVSELQQENQRLRVQLERLARQVEALSRSAGLPQEWQEEAERSPPGVGPSSPVPAFSADRFSTLAKLAVSGRSQSVDLDDHHKPEFRRVCSSSIIENGHQSSSGQAKASHELTSSYMSDSSPEAHAPVMTLQMPHLPVTAVTRTSEKFSGETVHSAGTTSASTGLLGQNQSKNEMALKTSNQSVNATSVTKPVSTASYEASSGNKTGESATDSYCGVTPKPHSSPPTVHRQVERRRELVRSQTLPRTTGTQARKALFEKFEQDSGNTLISRTSPQAGMMGWHSVLLYILSFLKLLIIISLIQLTASRTLSWLSPWLRKWLTVIV